MGAEDNKGVDLELLRERIGQIKGIGEARLNEIMLSSVPKCIAR